MVLAWLFFARMAPLFGEYAGALKPAVVTKGAVVTEGAMPVPLTGAEWSVIKKGHLEVYYRSSAGLKRIYRQLKRRFNPPGETIDRDAPIEDKLIFRLNILLNRVKDILGMYCDIPILRIRIYENRSALNDEYLKIFGIRQDFKSFYIDKYKTIYTSEEDISDSIISHEMGHAIIDYYFAVIPPPKVAELIASYVDMHLEE